MKNWFVVSFAVMAFLVACGKKEKKQGEIGKTVAGSALDCKVKDKENVLVKSKIKAQLLLQVKMLENQLKQKFLGLRNKNKVRNNSQIRKMQIS